jgi:hypothetical protein
VQRLALANALLANTSGSAVWAAISSSELTGERRFSNKAMNCRRLAAANLSTAPSGHAFVEGRYRVSAFVHYRPNGLILTGQVVQVEVYVNGFDYGGLGGFQANSDTGTELFLQGEDEVLAGAGDQITINVFQNTGQSGAVTNASHVLIQRLGN